jgi:hypothetical protein
MGSINTRSPPPNRKANYHRSCVAYVADSPVKVVDVRCVEALNKGIGWTLWSASSPFRRVSYNAEIRFYLFEAGIVVARQAHTCMADWIGMKYTRAAVLERKHL